MAKSFKDLSGDQQAKFAAKLKQLGIDPGTVPKTVSTATSNGGVCCGHPAGSSEFPPATVLKVGSVAALQALGGVKDNEYQSGAASDAFVKYPPSLQQVGAPTLQSCQGDVCKLKDSMTLDQHSAVSQAMHAYLLGDSSKVQDYEEHINAIHFPMQVAVHAAQDLVISANKPLIIDNPDGSPTSIVAGTVTVQPGGYILVKTPLNMDAQLFTVSTTTN
jgi:hypothetical protein